MNPGGWDRGGEADAEATGPLVADPEEVPGP